MSSLISNIQSLINNSQFEKALILTKKAIETNPQSITLKKFLAQIYSAKDDNYTAIKILFELVSNHPEDFDVNNNLGLYYLKVEDIENSLKYIDIAKSINPKAPTPYQNAGECYIFLKKFELAKENIDNSIKIYSESNTHHSSYIYLLIMRIQIFIAQNDKQGAINFINKYLAINLEPELILELAQIDKDQITKSMLDKIDLMLKNKNYTSLLDKFHKVVPLYFTLGKYYEKKNEIKSDEYYVKGNKEIINIQRYKVFLNQKAILGLIEKYDKIKNLDLNIKNNFSNNIFIVGMPRSGTTLLESVLSANEQVFAGGELMSFSLLFDRYLSSDSNFNEINFKLIGSEYKRITDFIKGSNVSIVDKIPGNFMHIGFILKFLPFSKLIILLRNPWDVAISLFKQRYATTVPYASSFFNIGVIMANFEAAINYWISNEEIRKKIYILKYEKLINEFDAKQKEIYEYCGILSSFNNDLRQRHFGRTASMNQVGRDLNRLSIEKKDFKDHKTEFYDAYESQKEFWIQKGLGFKSKIFENYS